MSKKVDFKTRLVITCMLKRNGQSFEGIYISCDRFLYDCAFKIRLNSQGFFLLDETVSLEACFCHWKKPVIWLERPSWPLISYINVM